MASLALTGVWAAVKAIATYVTYASAAYSVYQAVTYKKPEGPKRSIKGNLPSNNAPIPVIYGTRRVGGTRIFTQSTGTSNKYLHLVIVLGEGEITSIGDVYLDDIISTDLDKWGKKGHPSFSGLTTSIWTGTDWDLPTVSNWEGTGEEYASYYEATNTSSPLTESGLNPWTPTIGVSYRLQYAVGRSSGSVVFSCGGATGPAIEATGAYALEFVATTEDPPTFTPTGFTGQLTISSSLSPVAITSVTNLVTVGKHLGSDSQVADTDLITATVGEEAEWTTDHKLSGIAYVYVRFEYDPNVFSTLPVVTCDVVGKKCVDIRETGGVGSTPIETHNPAVCIWDYLTNERYGRGIPTDQLNQASFIAAANYCDEIISVAGNSQERYTCDGYLDTSQSTMDNLNALLTSCRGILVYSGGEYVLKIDKPESSSFNFTESNIVGEWVINTGSKETQFNRITTTFFNPDKKWEEDTAIIDSSYAVTDVRDTEDNGLLLEQNYELPFTIDVGTVKQISTINFNQSRQQISCEFTAFAEALTVEIGDVVSITHTTPGWTSKLFRVMKIGLKSNDEVKISCLEYDVSVYSYGTIAPPPAEVDTNLPNPFDPTAPTNLAIVESKHFTGVSEHNDVLLTWTASSDYLNKGYEVGIKPSGETAWQEVAIITDTQFEFHNLNGFYDFRVRTLTGQGFSDWTYLGRQNIDGVNEINTNPGGDSGLSVSIPNGLWCGRPGVDVFTLDTDGAGGSMTFADNGGILANGVMSVGNGLEIEGSLTVGENLTVDGNLDVGGDGNVQGNFLVGGDTTLKGDVTIGTPGDPSTLNLEGVMVAGPDAVTMLGTMTVGPGHVEIEGTISAVDANFTGITSDHITAGSIVGSSIASGTITAAQISANAITADEIAALTITATEIAAATITGDKIASGTIDTVNMVANSITSELIESGAVVADSIASSVITGDKIASLDLTTKTLTSDTGTIGGWSITPNLLKSAGTGARIELNQNKSRVSVFDASYEKVAMGYLENLPKHDGTGNWSASDYGFWARKGDNLVIDGGVDHYNGDFIVNNDAGVVIKASTGGWDDTDTWADASTWDDNVDDLIRLGTDSGEKGLFIYDAGVTKAKFHSAGMLIGSTAGTNKFLEYSVSTGDISFRGQIVDYTDWVDKNTDFTAEAGKRYRIDTSGSTAHSDYLKMTLPAGNVNDSVQWIDDTQNFGTKYLYIQANGSEKIMGVISGFTDGIMYCLNPNEDGILVYSGSTAGWRLV